MCDFRVNALINNKDIRLCRDILYIYNLAMLRCVISVIHSKLSTMKLDSQCVFITMPDLLLL